MRFLLPVLLAPSAHALPNLPDPLPPVAGNPADGLLDQPIEDYRYDHATSCSKRTKPGVVAMSEWLAANTRGVFWGSYRCETRGKDSASLHAENRAIDWHLDVAGNPQSLARRMGVQELIWDRGYWSAGMTAFSPHGPCYTKRGKLRNRVNKTIAHRDHIHLGMTKPGAKALTSFWAT